MTDAARVAVRCLLPNRNKRGVCRHIQRVTRLAALCEAQATHVRKECRNFLASMHQRTVIAPGADHGSTLRCQVIQPMVVVRADRVPGGVQIVRIRGPERKQIADDESTVAPFPGEGYAAPYGGVVLGLVCGRWVQHDEQHRWSL